MNEKILIQSENHNVKSIIYTLWFIILACVWLGFYAGYGVDFHEISGVLFFISILWIIIGFLIASGADKIELTITDKRAYGCTFWGKRVDLPLDSVSAVGLGSFDSIAITTPSGAINFMFIKNRDALYNVISNLLLERQNKPQISVAPTIVQSDADELMKYKTLLDNGAITQDEYNAKKKQILGF